MNQHDALYETARAIPGGVNALAARMSKMPPEKLYKKLRPAATDMQVSFEEATFIMEVAQESNAPHAVAALEAMAWRLGYVVVPMPKNYAGDESELLDSSLRTFKEFGDVAGALQDALRNDKRIDSKELEKIELEIREASSALHALRALVQKRAESDSK